MFRSLLLAFFNRDLKQKPIETLEKKLPGVSELRGQTK